MMVNTAGSAFAQPVVPVMGEKKKAGANYTDCGLPDMMFNKQTDRDNENANDGKTQGFLRFMYFVATPKCQQS